MALSPRSKAAVAALCAAFALSGCGAEYMNNRDRVSARAGNSHEANTAIMEVTAWPPYANNTSVVFGG